MKNYLFLTLLIAIVASYGCSGAKASAGSTNAEPGKSYATAIKVNSIDEEYAYARENCSGCKFTSQSLPFQGKKPYDILNYITPEGNEVAYYFDISSFYGKGF